MQITWDGQFDEHTTFGVISTRMCQELQKIGVDVWINPWVESTIIPQEFKNKIAVGRKGHTVRLSGVTSASSSDYHFTPDFTPIYTGSAFTVTIDNLKRTKNLIVPSWWQKANLNSFGIDSDVCARGSDMPPIGNTKTDHKYTFLFLGYIMNYKGVHLLAEAFEKAFDENSNVRLILKGNDLKTHTMQHSVERLKEMFPTTFSKLEIIYENWSYKKLEELYARSNCFVSPHCTLGMFGTRTALDARKAGLPLIHPNLGEPTFWGDTRNLVDYNLGGDNSMSAIEVDTDDFAKKMSHCVVNRVTSTPLEGWTWKDSAEQFYNILKKGRKQKHISQVKQVTIADYHKSQNKNFKQQ